MQLERVEAIYNELTTLVVELVPDPTALGPAYLQDLISRTRGYLNRTSLLIHEVHRERHQLERELDAHEAAFQASSDELLAEDRRVTLLPNIDDRRAMINLLLRDDRTKITDLKRRIKELGFVEKAVKHRHRELDNTISNIRMQKSLIDVEIRTGASYGDETDTSRGTVRGYMADDIDADELAKLLNGTTDEAAPETPEAANPSPPEAEKSAPQPVVVPTPEEPKATEAKTDDDEDVLRFLEGDDYSDVLNSV